jgi:uncharacterized protein (DUF1786 family)
LRYSLDRRASVSLTLHDALGRIVAMPIGGEIQERGEHRFSLSTEDLEPGIYSCRLRAGVVEMFTRLVVVR